MENIIVAARVTGHSKDSDSDFVADLIVVLRKMQSLNQSDSRCQVGERVSQSATYFKCIHEPIDVI